jgi:hypothetical protein
MAQHTRTAKILLLVMLTFMSLAQIREAESAAPSLFYSLLSIDRSMDSCLKRAYKAVASEVAGEIINRSEDVALVNKDYNLAVHCRKTGANTTFVTIMVAHRSSFNEAKGLALNIRRGMETGLFE